MNTRTEINGWKIGKRLKTGGQKKMMNIILVFFSDLRLRVAYKGARIFKIVRLSRAKIQFSYELKFHLIIIG